MSTLFHIILLQKVYLYFFIKLQFSSKTFTDFIPNHSSIDSNNTISQNEIEKTNKEIKISYYDIKESKKEIEKPNNEIKVSNNKIDELIFLDLYGIIILFY